MLIVSDVDFVQYMVVFRTSHFFKVKLNPEESNKSWLEKSGLRLTEIWYDWESTYMAEKEELWLWERDQCTVGKFTSAS